jgi:predicted HAD superfamily Cof-like phosphohydrolase
MEENTEKDIIQMIKHWSQVFDLPVKTTFELPSPERIRLCFDLIDEEFMETVSAIDDKNEKEIKDGLGDLLWVTIRAMMEFGIDPQEVITKIYESNMSKADTSEKEAVITYHKYMEQGIHTYSKKVGDHFITYRMSDNKVLKSHKFQEPNL